MVVYQYLVLFNKNGLIMKQGLKIMSAFEFRQK